MSCHKYIQIHLKISATFWLVYKKQRHHYLNETFAHRQHPTPSQKNFAPHMFNYSSPSVKNSALLALASIPHKLAGRLIFGIWCRAVLLFLLSSVGLLAFWGAQQHSQTHTHIFMHSRKCTRTHDATRLSILYERNPFLSQPVAVHLSLSCLQQVWRFKQQQHCQLHAAIVKSATARYQNTGTLKSAWFGVKETFATNVNFKFFY